MSIVRFKKPGEGTGFVMIGSETSYTACRNILDVKEGNARHYHLESRAGRGIVSRFMEAEP